MTRIWGIIISLLIKGSDTFKILKRMALTSSGHFQHGISTFTPWMLVHRAGHVHIKKNAAMHSCTASQRALNKLRGFATTHTHAYRVAPDFTYSSFCFLFPLTNVGGCHGSANLKARELCLGAAPPQSVMWGDKTDKMAAAGRSRAKSPPGA